jgi:hypothetical protein
MLLLSMTIWPLIEHRAVYVHENQKRFSLANLSALLSSPSKTQLIATLDKYVALDMALAI